MKKFNQLCEQMDYKTYMNISNYTYDYAYVQNLYQEFINNYNKLNEVFGLENPIEICTMFNNVLFGGYLSKDKSFEYTKENISSRLFPGTDIMGGSGCCRHISILLTDILNNYGINSTTVGGLWTKWHTVYEMREKTKKLRYINRIIGNHAITFANKDGHNYFLDPTNYCFFRYDDFQKSLVCGDYHFKISPVLSWALSSCTLSSCALSLWACALSGYKATKKAHKLIQEHHPNIDSDTEIQMIENAETLYDDNQDIFENFYHDNRELCEEIAEKSLTLKKSVIRKSK